MGCVHSLQRGVVIVAAGLGLARGAAGQATFQGTGFLGGMPSFSRAWGVSGDGTVVVGDSRSPRSGTETEGFSLVQGNPIEGLGTLSPTFFASIAYGVSANGQVPVGSSFYDASRLDQAVRWNVGSIVGMGGFPPAPVNSVAYAANSDGGVVVGFAKTSEAGGSFRDQAWRWTSGGGKVTLNFLAVPAGEATHRISWASGVSADGNTIVGFSASNADQRAVVWKWPNLSPSRLSGDTTLGSQANGVSDDGRVIVGYAVLSDGGQSAFRWTTDEGFQILGDLPGVAAPYASAALGASADGSIVVGYGNLASNNFNGEAMVWDFGGMRPLRQALIDAGATGLTGWQLWWATSVSDDGRVIVGFGQNPSGRTEGFKAYLPRCDIDFNRDRFINLDDLGDFITEFYNSPAVPGGWQAAAATLSSQYVGLGTPCPLAPDAPAPFNAGAYRNSGYRAGFSTDGGNNCPQAPSQPFPNLDNLNDYITEFYTGTCR